MMEDNRRDPSSEFDSEYIDQLFSAGRTPAKQESPSAPAPQPEPDPEPAAAEPPKPAEPAAKPFPKPLLILIAIALLGVGFLLGRLPGSHRHDLPATDPSGQTSAHIQTAPSTDSGIAVDYTSMSTRHLADIASQIQQLSSYGMPNSSKTLSINIYQQLKYANPVLVELEQRKDAVTQLSAAAASATDRNASYAASALIRYYIVYLGFNAENTQGTAPASQWLCDDNTYFRIYEYIEAPLVTHTFSQSTIFDFKGTLFELEDGFIEDYGNDPNFWYRIEPLQDISEDQQAYIRNPMLSYQGAGNDAWLSCRRYDKGWFVYGYAAGKTAISFTIEFRGSTHDIHLIVSPVPGDGESPAAFAQCFLDQVQTLQRLPNLNPDKKLKNYPIMEAVLKQPGAITALLNLAQSSSAWVDNKPNSGSGKNLILPLLDTADFRNRMTISESRALQALCGYGKYLDPTSLSEPAIVETAEGFILTGLPGLHVGDKPENLKDIPLSEMNYWAYVPLTEDVIMLQQPNWDLEITLRYSGLAGAWPVYDSNDQLAGWVISGQLKWDDLLHLDLLQGNGTVFSTSIHAEPLNT